VAECVLKMFCVRWNKVEFYYEYVFDFVRRSSLSFAMFALLINLFSLTYPLLSSHQSYICPSTYRALYLVCLASSYRTKEQDLFAKHHQNAKKITKTRTCEEERSQNNHKNETEQTLNFGF
jgi:hypothetical protein